MSRWLSAVGLILSLVGVGSAQTALTETPHVPDKTSLDRLNLRSEWALHLPVEWRHDSVTLIQIFGDQLFVQTRTGQLIALDANNGRIQWTTSLGNGQYTNTYALAANSRFVFAINVTTLYAFHRYTGFVEFTTDLGTLPTAGLSANETTVYAVLAMKPGFAGSSRVEAYQLPTPIPMPTGNQAGKVDARGRALPNPVDTLLQRYPTAGVPRTDYAEPEPNRRPTLRTVPSGGYAGSNAPSLAIVPSVLPPYTKESGVGTPSLTTLPSLKQPYRLQNSESRTYQNSASLAAIPPSVAAALMLSDLRPKGLQPQKVLEVSVSNRILFPLLLTPLRAWAATSADQIVAVSTRSRSREVVHNTSALVSAAPAQAADMGYFPIGDGNLLAIDLTTGNLTGGANVLWRATVSGLMNHSPLVTRDAVYASGDNSGVTRVDRTTGKLIWQSEGPADRVLAANDDFVYVRNRQGRLLIYDARKPLDPDLGDVRPLTGLDLPAFNVPFTNTVTDRLYLAADNGLIVCLRDASAKYARPVRMAPDSTPPPPKKDGPEMPPMPAEQPKQP